MIKRNPTIAKNLHHGFSQSDYFTRPSSGKKGQKLLLSLEQRNSSIVNRHYSTHHEKTGGYRFLNNNRVTESLLVKSLQYQCQQNSDGLHIIGLQDTTEYNYNHHIKRLKKDTLGVVGNNSNLGYYAHLMVAFDAVSCLPQGISYCKMWGREHHRKNRHERQYQDLPIEEKESYRWLEAADQTRKLLSTAKHFTFISDRESDIYQLWDRIPDDKPDFIIRARQDVIQ